MNFEDVYVVCVKEESDRVADLLQLRLESESIDASLLKPDDRNM